MSTPAFSQATPYISNSASAAEVTSDPPAHPPEAPTEEPALPLLPSATKTENFLLTAADQESGTRDERLNRVIRSKYEAGLLKPYEYVKGYARLSRWMDRNVSRQSKQQILQPLSVLRPKFRAVAQSLRDIDLLFIEEAFERLLLNYDRVFSAMGVPACLWRRTGVRSTKETTSFQNLAQELMAFLRPWLLQPFDQVLFEPVSEERYLEIEREFNARQYKFKIEPAVFSMAAYITFTDGIEQEITEFKRKQAEGTAREEARETELLREWQAQKAAKASPTVLVDDTDVGPGSTSVVSSISSSVWKIKCQPGDVIQSADEVLIILEAMKTDINILAGEEKFGKVVKSLGKGIREGASVQAGDVLAWFE